MNVRKTGCPNGHRKRVWAALMALCLMCMAVSVTALADDTGTLLVVSAEVDAQNAQMTLTMTVPENAGVAAGKFAFNYDTDNLELVSASYDGFTGAIVQLNSKNAGRIVVSLASTEEITAGGSVIAVFNLKEGTYDSSFIEITDYQLGNADGEILDNLSTAETVPVEVSCVHSYGDWTVTTAATCTTAGERVHVCTVCGEKETEVIAALGHTEGEWVTVKEATESEEGLKEVYCTVCGELLDSKAIPVITTEPETTPSADSPSGTSENEAKKTGDAGVFALALLAVAALTGCVFGKKKFISE